MVHKRYIKKNGKLIGPYYYESYRENGRVKKRYLGNVLPSGYVDSEEGIVEKSLLIPSKSSSPGFSLSVKSVFAFMFLLFVGFLVVLLFFNSANTSLVILDVSPSYNLNEVLSGQAIITIESGDYLPVDSAVYVKLVKDGEVVSQRTESLNEFFSDKLESHELSDTREVCHDVNCGGSDGLDCERVCANESVSLGNVYNSPGRYERSIEEIISYNLTEVGRYEITFAMPTFDVAVSKTFEVIGKIEVNNTGDVIENSINNTSLNEGSNFNDSINGEPNVSVQTTRARIKLGEPVRWVKNISLDVAGNVTIEIPAEAEKIEVKIIDDGEIRESGNFDVLTGNSVLEQKGKGFVSRFFALITGKVVDESSSSELIDVQIEENATDYLIEYETPAPVAIESETSTGKEVIISAPDGLGYTDVLSYTEIAEVVDVGNEDEIKIYWVENESYVPFDAYDLDANGKIDYVEWITPHLSNQTFNIILITKAEILDNNRAFVEDVYDYVKSRDYNYTSVSDGYYLRVTFEHNLSSNNDITLYAKSNGGRVEVYEKDGNEKVADFGEIGSDGRYKIILNSLVGEQDVFDLRVIGAVDFDYVVDPTLAITVPEADGYYGPNTWVLDISWGNSTTCEYSYDNNIWNSTACGNDIPDPITAGYSGGYNTLYINGTDSEGNFDIVSQGFNYDAVNTSIDFISPSPYSAGNAFNELLQIGVSASDLDSGLKNITVYVYNDSGFVNESTSDTSPFYVNFSLSNGSYLFNASAFDNAGNYNLTLTRNVSVYNLDWNGSGSLEDPYEINDCLHLQAAHYFDLSTNYNLTSDIDCSDTSTWNYDSLGGFYRGFIPIGYLADDFGGNDFTGTLYGSNHTISNLVIYLNSSNCAGLFCSLGGEVRDLGIVDASITKLNSSISQSGVGAVAGTNAALGLINRTYVTGLISGFENIGCLVGNNYGTIENSYSSCVISSTGNAGGIVGDNSGGTVRNSYSAGSVSADYSAGGIDGVGGNVYSCFSTAVIVGGSNVGAISGVYGAIIDSSYWNNGSMGVSNCYSGGNDGCTAIDNNLDYFKGDVSGSGPFTNWDFAATWNEVTAGYPILAGGMGPGDIIAPNLTVYSPIEGGAYTNPNVTINFSAEDDVLVDSLWFDNGTDNISYSSPLNVTLDTGNYLFTFYANDSSGNVNATSVNFSALGELSVGDVYYCGVINSAGTYTLATDVVAPWGVDCFVINSNDVILDGNRHRIDGAYNESLPNRGVVANGRDNITIKGFDPIVGFYEASGILVVNSQRVNIYDNTIGDNGYNVYFSDVSNSSINNNNMSYAWLSGIQINLGSDNSILNNILTRDINGELGQGIYLNSTSQNIVSGNSIMTENVGIKLENSDSNLFVSNSIWNIFYNSFLDLGGSTNNSVLYNNSDGQVVWTDSSLLDNLTTTGAESYKGIIFTDDPGYPERIWIQFNNSYLNTEFVPSEFNSSANITFYGMPGTFANPAIMKDGIECSDCYNFTSLNAETVVFNVSSWSSYSIGESSSPCINGNNEIFCCAQVTQSGTYTLNQSIQASGAGPCIDVGANDVTIDLNGYNITADSGASDNNYGVYVDGYNSTTVTSSNGFGEIIDFSSYPYSSSGIYLNNSFYSVVSNINFSGVRVGVTLDNSHNATITGLTMMQDSTDGTRIHLRSGSSYNTFSDINVSFTSANAIGLFLEGGSNENSFTNLNVSHNANKGILIDSCSYNSFSNIDASHCGVNGLNIISGSHNSFDNLDVSFAGQIGADLFNTNNNTFTNLTAKKCYYEGLSTGYWSKFNSFNGMIRNNYQSNLTKGLDVNCIPHNETNIDNGVNYVNQEGCSWLGSPTLDVLAPEITVYTPEAIVYDINNVTINFTAVDDYELDKMWFNNGTNNITYTEPVNLTLDNGEHTFVFYANDSAGNLNSTSVTFDTGVLTPGDVNRCGVINSAGTYTLASDINASGYGMACIYINSSDVTLDGQGYTISRPDQIYSAVYVNAVSNVIIQNVTSSSFNYGVYVYQSSNCQVLDSNITGFYYDGIHFEGGSDGRIENNYISGGTGLGTAQVELSSNSDRNVVLNNVFVDSNGAMIYISGGSDNEVANNNMSGLSGDAILLEYSSTINNTIRNNTITGGVNNGIRVKDGSNGNLIADNTLYSSQGMQVQASNNNSFVNNTVYYWTGARGILISSASNGTLLLNNNLYVINAASEKSISETVNGTGNIFVNNNSFGEIKWTDSAFLSNLTTVGNLTFPGSIVIDNNSAYFNSSAFAGQRINSSANITFYGMSANFTNPAIMKDGVQCTDCYNFTNLNDSTVVFNVSSWSNYSIAELPNVVSLDSCTNITQSGDYELINNISSPATCININASNVHLNCNGFSINHSTNSLLVGYGVNISQANGTLIENCNIYDSPAGYLLGRVNIYSGAADDLILRNNTLRMSTLGVAIQVYALRCNITGNNISQSYQPMSIGWGGFDCVVYGNNFVGDSQVTLSSRNVTMYNNTFSSTLLVASNSNLVYNNTFNLNSSASGLIRINGANNSFYNNTVNNYYGQGFYIYSLDHEGYNSNIIDSSNLVDGRPVNYTYNAHDAVFDGIDFTQYGQVIFADSSNLMFRNSNFSRDGLSLVSTNSSAIHNNLFNTSSGYGVSIIINSSNNTVYDNDFQTTRNYLRGAYIDSTDLGVGAYNNISSNRFISNSSSTAIYIFNNINNSDIYNNTINALGVGSTGIYIGSNPTGNLIRANIINGSGSNSYGILIGAVSTRNYIINNSIFSPNFAAGIGIQCGGCSNQVFENNSISGFGQEGVLLGLSSGNNLFLNNNISNNLRSFYDQSGTSDSVIYNNSFGEIKWVLGSVNSSNNLTFGDTVKVQYDSVVYTPSGNESFDHFNTSANITLYNMPTNFIYPVIYRNGNQVCNSTTTPACYNFTSLNDSTIRFNVSSWSNYSVMNINDTTPPTAQSISPSNNSHSNSGSNNFTANFSDDVGLANSTLFIYDLLGNLANQTTIALNGALQATIGVVVNLVDGVYTWFYQVFDLLGNAAVTENRTIIVDTISPQVNIVVPVNNTTYVSTSYNINITLNEQGYCEYSLNGGVANQTLTSVGGISFIKTNTIVADANYTLNAYCNDSTGNRNDSVYVDFGVKLPVCGNGVVEFGESCDSGAGNGVCPSTCSASCTTNTCNGGGPSCTSTTWTCGSWGVCSGGSQERSCTDNCGITRIENQSCTISENCTSTTWTCGSWSNCSNSLQTRSCIDNCNSSRLENQSCISLNETCTQNWQCSSWSACNNGLSTRICNDLNNCGDNSLKPAESMSCFVGPQNQTDNQTIIPDEVLRNRLDNCTPEVVCGEYGECKYSASVNDLFGGVVRSTGTQARECVDSEKCISTYFEERMCNLEIAVDFIKNVDPCDSNKQIITVVKKGTKDPVAQIDALSLLESDILNVRFLQNATVYCAECYNGIKDNNEEDIDCGGSCRACRAGSIWLNVLKQILWVLVIILLFVDIWFIINMVLRKDSDKIENLIVQGRKFLKVGDIGRARLVYREIQHKYNRLRSKDKAFLKDKILSLYENIVEFELK